MRRRPALTPSTAGDLPRIERRIALHAGRAGVAVPSAALPALARHLAMVLRWSRATRLTAIDSVDRAIERHVIESAAASPHLGPRGPLLDVGSGNGYPGLVLKVLHPEIPAILLEPGLRKSVFLRQVIRDLALEGVEVVRGRIDRPRDLLPYAPLGTITVRAVGAARAVISGAPGALASGGRLLYFAGVKGLEEAREDLPPGLVIRVETPLPGLQRARLLVLERIPE